MTGHQPDDAIARVAIIGAGSIGVGWSVVFARAGLAVSLYDAEPGRLEQALAELRARLDDLTGFELLDEAPAVVAARVSPAADLGAALGGAGHVQECVPEDLALKQELFAELDRRVPPGVALASSSSAMTASAIAAALPGRERCLVVHPGN